MAEEPSATDYSSNWEQPSRPATFGPPGVSRDIPVVQSIVSSATSTTNDYITMLDEKSNAAAQDSFAARSPPSPTPAAVSTPEHSLPEVGSATSGTSFVSTEATSAMSPNLSATSVPDSQTAEEATTQAAVKATGPMGQMAVAGIFASAPRRAAKKVASMFTPRRFTRKASLPLEEALMSATSPISESVARPMAKSLVASTTAKAADDEESALSPVSPRAVGAIAPVVVAATACANGQAVDASAAAASPRASDLYDHQWGSPLSADSSVDFIQKETTLQLMQRSKYVIPGAIGAFLLLVVTVPILLLVNRDAAMSYARVAFVGNSMQYYNDLPRFMEALSDNHLSQDSVLHGDATIVNLIQTGNGMYQKFNTTNALIPNTKLHDFGACTVHQLILGYDRYLYNQWLYLNESSVTDDYTGPIDDGTNPCLEDEKYLKYKLNQMKIDHPKWDFIFINDNTRSPARTNSRIASLATLNSTYVSWFKKNGATPVFLCTYAYWTQWRNMQGLQDVPTFTSLTYEGYRQYAELLSNALPSNQKARIAPVGLAFLLVWEENPTMWKKLFHYDEIHPSPHGTFLQGLVVHHTLFGRLPSRSRVVTENTSSLFSRARRMQPPMHPHKPFPTKDEASYLYKIAARIAKGKVPKSFIKYTNGEGAADYDDDATNPGYDPYQ